MPSTGNIFDVADHEGMVGDEGVSGGTDGSAPKCEGREGYYRVSEPLVMGVPGLKLQHPQHTAGLVRHTVSARPGDRGTELRLTADGSNSEYPISPADSQFQTISQKQRIDAEMRLIFRSSTFTTLDPADDPRFA